jgi:ATP-dependent RNA helicase DeaD
LSLVKKIRNVEVDERGISKYMAPVVLELEDLSREDIIQRVVSIEFNRFLDYYRNAIDLNVDIAHQGRGSSRSGEGSRSKEPRLFINLGSVDGFDKFRMMDYVKEVANLKKGEIGKVDVKGVYSFVEVPPEKLSAVMDSFKGEIFKGRQVRTEQSGQEKKSYSGGSGGGASRRSSSSSSAPRNKYSGKSRGSDRESSGRERESSGEERSGGGAKWGKKRY